MPIIVISSPHSPEFLIDKRECACGWVDFNAVCRRSATAQFPPAGIGGAASATVSDTVVTAWTLCSILHPVAALSEMRRVLRPGGPLLFVEDGPLAGASRVAVAAMVDTMLVPYSGGCHLYRKMDDLIRVARSQIDEIETNYMQGPKPWAFMYQGSATK